MATARPTRQRVATRSPAAHAPPASKRGRPSQLRQQALAASLPLKPLRASPASTSLAPGPLRADHPTLRSCCEPPKLGRCVEAPWADRTTCQLLAALHRADARRLPRLGQAQLARLQSAAFDLACPWLALCAERARRPWFAALAKQPLAAALGTLNEQLTAWPADASARRQRGELLLQAGRFGEAREQFNWLVHQRADEPLYWLGHSLACRGAGDRAAAHWALQRACTRASQPPLLLRQPLERCDPHDLAAAHRLLAVLQAPRAE